MQKQRAQKPEVNIFNKNTLHLLTEKYAAEGKNLRINTETNIYFPLKYIHNVILIFFLYKVPIKSNNQMSFNNRPDVLSKE